MNRKLTGYFVVCSAAPVAYLIAAAWVRVNDDFGAGDLGAFAVWSGVLLLPLTLAFRAITPLLAGRSRSARAAMGLGVGIFAGICYTIVLALGMGPWIGAFSFPILYIWAAAGGLAAALAASLWPGVPAERGTRLVVWRVVWFVAGCVLAGFAPMGFMFGEMFFWNRASLEQYFVPEGFTGPVVIIYDQPTAPPLPEVDGARQIHIPASGVLLTSSALNEGWKDPSVYAVDARGSQVPVASDWSHSGTGGDTIRTFWLGTRFPGTVNGVAQPGLRYEAFVLGSPRYDAQFEARADSLIDSLWTIYAR